MRRGVIALGILGGALPASCVERSSYKSIWKSLKTLDRPQLACVDNREAILERYEQHFSLYNSVQEGVKKCCEGGSKATNSYFALGGNNTYSLGQGIVCAWDIRHLVGDKGEKIRSLSECTIGCPGYGIGLSEKYGPVDYGQCGGGCKGCDLLPTQACQGDDTVPCGSYFSVYSCNKDELTLKLPDASTPEYSASHHPPPPVRVVPVCTQPNCLGPGQRFYHPSYPKQALTGALGIAPDTEAWRRTTTPKPPQEVPVNEKDEEPISLGPGQKFYHPSYPVAALTGLETHAANRKQGVSGQEAAAPATQNVVELDGQEEQLVQQEIDQGSMNRLDSAFDLLKSLAADFLSSA